MFVESRSVSHTAAEFATRYLFSDDFMTRARQAKVPKGTSVFTECTCVCVCHLFVKDEQLLTLCACFPLSNDFHSHPDSNTNRRSYICHGM